MRPSRALRAALVAEQQGRAGEFVTALMRGYWADGFDITDPEALGELAGRCGLDAKRVRSATASHR